MAAVLVIPLVLLMKELVTAWAKGAGCALRVLFMRAASK